MPFAIVAFFAGMFLFGLVGFIHPPKPLFGFAPEPWGMYALIWLGLNAANFALLVYFYRQPRDWRIHRLSRTTFLAIMVVSYLLGIFAGFWMLAGVYY
jgi:hypothetical protein